jgi:predicted enzyme related to lactoylglutathione lyase
MAEQQSDNNVGVDEGIARHGKLSYMQIPAADTSVLATFYRDVFAWNIMGGGPDHLSFADASGELIGAFVTSIPVVREPGILPYIYVDGVDAMVEKITSNGGEVVRAPYAEGALRVATFRDPAGNVLGIWQAP